MAGVADECLGAAVLDDWVDYVTSNNQREFKNHKSGKKYLLDEIKNLLARGFEAVKNTLGMKEPHYIEGLFFESSQQAWNHSFEFARIASLKYEPRGRSRFPPDWAPVLTLGSVVKVISRGEGEPKAAHLPSEYLVCVQPLCHSVRLDDKAVLPDGTVAFPFQTATVATPTAPKFNLAIRDEQAKNVDLLVGWKPREGVIFRFRPDAVRQVVPAARDTAGNYVFTGEDGNTFLWLGDIKTGVAQRSASKLATHIHTPGTNEFEWLRQAAERKIDYDGKIVVAIPTGASSVPPPGAQ